MSIIKVVLLFLYSSMKKKSRKIGLIRGIFPVGRGRIGKIQIGNIKNIQIYSPIPSSPLFPLPTGNIPHLFPDYFITAL